MIVAKTTVVVITFMLAFAFII